IAVIKLSLNKIKTHAGVIISARCHFCTFGIGRAQFIVKIISPRNYLQRKRWPAVNCVPLFAKTTGVA
ncbi:hypothetical protein, partial [Serratia sarumanii]